MHRQDLKFIVSFCWVAFLLVPGCSVTVVDTMSVKSVAATNTATSTIRPTVKPTRVVAPTFTHTPTETPTAPAITPRTTPLNGVFVSEGFVVKDYVCTRFYRFYEDGYVIFVDACSGEAESPDRHWPYVRDDLRRWEGYSMGPWSGGYDVTGTELYMEFVRVRSTVTGDEVMVITGTLDHERLTIDGLTYQECGTYCPDPVED